MLCADYIILIEKSRKVINIKLELLRQTKCFCFKYLGSVIQMRRPSPSTTVKLYLGDQLVMGSNPKTTSFNMQGESKAP